MEGTAILKMAPTARHTFLKGLAVLVSVYCIGSTIAICTKEMLFRTYLQKSPSPSVQKSPASSLSSPYHSRAPEKPSLNKTSASEVHSVNKSTTSKVTHIGFLKVHKAGSTTMQNMLFRFALKHNKTLIIPKKGNYFLDKNEHLYEFQKGQHNDILAVHSIYNKEIYSQVLHPDSVYIGIVRDPLDRMISAANYYRDVFPKPYLKRIPRDTLIQSLVNDPDKCDKGPFSWTRNAMGKDFGFPSELKPTNTKLIHRRLDELKKDFRLVLVTEMFDESLVLMRRYLNWTVSDIIYLETNAHTHKTVNLTDEEKSKFKSTCFMDYAIYEEFKHELTRKLSVQDDDFWMEVRKLKSVKSDISNYCNSKRKTMLTVDSSKWSEMFSVTTEDCNWMRTDELEFIEKIRQQMVASHNVTS